MSFHANLPQAWRLAKYFIRAYSSVVCTSEIATAFE